MPAVACGLRRVTRRAAVVAVRGVDRERAHAPHQLRRPSTSGCSEMPDDRDRGPERGDPARGGAALGRAHDRGDAEVFGGLHRRVRDGPRDPVVVDRGGRALRASMRVLRPASAASATSPSCARCRSGSAPTAVSSESMSASVPSSTALATSFTSARVGSGERVIDSSICVAVITGLPAMLQNRMISFWISGTRRAGNLDAEVAAGDHHRVGRADDARQGGRARPRSRSWRRACGRCPRLGSRARTASTSSGRRTNDSPTKSALIAIAISSATASASVNGSTWPSARGTCMPLRDRSTPPRTTSHTTSSPSIALDAQHDRAVGEEDVVAGPDPARELGERGRDAVRVADDGVGGRA